MTSAPAPSDGVTTDQVAVNRPAVADVRFGIADRQRGASKISRWRQRTLFGYPDRAVEGRQSQVWVRFGEGWRIVAAHVSEAGIHA